MMEPIDLFYQVKSDHINRHYTSDKGELDISQFNRFCDYYPNEAIYLIDCKNVTLYCLNKNFGEITSSPSRDEDEIYPLYNHIHRNEFEKFSKFTRRLVELASSQPENWQEYIDHNRLLYKSCDGKILMKTTMGIIKDQNGCIRWTMGRIADVSELVPNYVFRYSFSGVNEGKIFAAFNNLQEFNSILGKREIEILNYVGLGYSSQQIANILFVSRNTVDTHRRNIIHKLDASNSTNAYKKAKDMGLVC